MKKVIMFISLITTVLTVLFISSVKIFAHSPYIHVNTFDLSTQTVSFGDSDYYILRSPYRDLVTDNYTIYDQEFDGDGVNLLYTTRGTFDFVTSPLSNGQYNYSLILNELANRTFGYDILNEVYLSDILTTSLYDELDYPITYTLDIDYVSAVPFNFILSYSGTRWNNGWSSPFNNKVYGLKFQFFSYINEDGDPNTYVNLYGYDVNGNSMGLVWTFDYWPNDVLNIGIAIKPDTTSVDTAYIDGYNNGYANGENQGFSDGYGQGLNGGYNNGYNVGFDDGYISGYDEGTQLETDVRPMFQTLITFIGSVFSLTIFPGVTIGTLASIPIMFALFKWFMKIFGGK